MSQYDYNMPFNSLSVQAQKEGNVFNETFAPVVKHSTIKTSFSLCSELRFKNLSNGRIDCVLLWWVRLRTYIDPPEGFEGKVNKYQMLKLKKQFII